MREVFDDEELPPVEPAQDTEVTLGPMAVTGLLFGLLLLCGLCFGLGYSMGSRGSKGVLASGPVPAASANNAAGGSASKPEAAPAKISTAQPATQASQAGSSGASPDAIRPSGSDSGQPGGTLMVQIATVSNHEDADVLVSALHKRGYAVSLSQDDADGQFHVRVGPFANLDEADAMRQKLLNDGYNAVVQQ
ncbi:MAG: SPOR domain-containing protein [Terracidiphilus sp.]